MEAPAAQSPRKQQQNQSRRQQDPQHPYPPEIRIADHRGEHCGIGDAGQAPAHAAGGEHEPGDSAQPCQQARAKQQRSQPCRHTLCARLWGRKPIKWKERAPKENRQSQIVNEPRDDQPRVYRHGFTSKLYFPSTLCVSSPTACHATVYFPGASSAVKGTINWFLSVGLRLASPTGCFFPAASVTSMPEKPSTMPSLN